VQPVAERVVWGKQLHQNADSLVVLAVAAQMTLAPFLVGLR